MSVLFFFIGNKRTYSATSFSQILMWVALVMDGLQDIIIMILIPPGLAMFNVGYFTLRRLGSETRHRPDSEAADMACQNLDPTNQLRSWIRYN
jgi:hypothetical protein